MCDTMVGDLLGEGTSGSERIICREAGASYGDTICR